MTDPQEASDSPIMPPPFDDRLAPIIDGWAPHLAHLAHAAVHIAAVDCLSTPPITTLSIPALAGPVEYIARALDQAAAAYEIELDPDDTSAYSMHFDATTELAGHLLTTTIGRMRLPADHVVHHCHVHGYVAPPDVPFTTRIERQIHRLIQGSRADHAWPSKCTPIWSDITLRPTVDDAVAAALDILPAVPHPDSRRPKP